jgi:4-hydroxy-tetrahydrodipicolinate reductase
MNDSIALAVNGACGRMGQRVVALALADARFRLVAACDLHEHPAQGKDLGAVCGLPPQGIKITPQLPLEPRPDVVIDFSSPEGTMWLLGACASRRIPILVATTGHSAAQLEDIRAAAHETAVLKAANLSLGMNLLVLLLGQAAKALKGQDYDVEIIEKHHRYKKDAPSGTALHLAQVIQQAMGQTRIRHGREGPVGERPGDEIGIHAVRTGDNVGEHDVYFSTLGETLQLAHRATSRDCFVRGALQAARFLAGKPAGWYEMSDVLGL